MKRVASAVGEGSAAVQLVHKVRVRVTFMPAARQRSRSPCMAWAVMAMMGMAIRDRRTCGLADLAGGLEAVHHRHLHVHQHQVVRDGLERLEGLGAVGHGLGAQAQFLEHAQRHLLVGDIVLGQQDARLD